MRRLGKGNGRRLTGRQGIVRRALATLLVALLVLQCGPTQAFAVAAEEAATQQLVAGLTAGDPEAEAQLMGALSGDDATAEKNNEVADASQASGETAGEDDASDSEEPASDAELLRSSDLVAVTLQGEAATSESAAKSTLVAEEKLSDEEAAEMVVPMFEATQSGAGDSDGESRSTRESLTSSGDGSTVNSIKAVWITQDTPEGYNDGTYDYDPNTLYLKPSSNADQSVRLRVSYSLSGQHSYNPGDITITIPTNIFVNRDGDPEGSMRLSVPASPSTTGEWNYQQVGDTYVITNTRQMSAATQGYIEFAIEGITPSDMVDCKVSDPFQAVIRVVTNKGNVIGKRSSELTALFNTHAEIDSATKRLYGSVGFVGPGSIPVNQRIEGESSYLVVTWYMNAYVDSTVNQPYSLVLKDEKGDEYKGFIINGASGEDGVTSSLDQTVMTDEYRVGPSRYTTVQVAYPMSQFKKGEEYTFKNKVTYTLTETDPKTSYCPDGFNDIQDEQQVTTAEATAETTWSYEVPQFADPTGHFNIFKYGNSHQPMGDFGMETVSSAGGVVMDLSSISGYTNYSGYFGIYPSALNDIREGKTTDISYTINTVGYMFPWTYQAPDSESDESDESPFNQLENYGKRSVTMTTEDRGLFYKNGSEAVPLVQGVDYLYKSVEFPVKPVIRKATALHPQGDGSIDFDTAQDGTVDYAVDSDSANIADVTLQIQRSGEWEDYATASWKTGSPVITMTTGETLEGLTVDLPEETENVRTVVETKSAGYHYYIRVNATLKPSERLSAIVAEAFEKSTEPSLSVWNGAKLDVVQTDDGNKLVTIEKEGFDKLNGFTSDMRVLIKKESKQDLDDVDTERGTVTVHYSAEVDIQSTLSDKATYEEALADGRLQAECGGTWYDLLPQGMTPNLSTVKLRSGDSIREMYTIEDYQGSGRTLLVVSADLTPVTRTYKMDQTSDATYYQDVITIEFDAEYSRESIEDYGDTIHNVIAYKSDNDNLGTTEGYRGENNPYTNNNNSTETAFAEGEQDILASLSEGNEGKTNFLYAGVDRTIDRLDVATSELGKLVQVNEDGRWSTGLNEDEDPSNARDVYVGGRYSYRIRMASFEGTETSDIIVFDSLENFYAQEGNEEEDIDAPRWQGTFAGIDVSLLKEAGCAPVVYYSSNPNLVLEDQNAATDEHVVQNEATTLNENGSLPEEYWQLLDENAPLEDIKAIAIDMRKSADGGDFILGAGEHLTAYVYMSAPVAEEASLFVEQDAHAYNNIYMLSTSTEAGSSDAGELDFIRQDYTKVGLMEYDLKVTKAWSDENNQDGLRPDSVTVHLYADGEPAEEKYPTWFTADKATLTLSAENEWSGSFDALPYLRDDGSKIIYTLREDVPQGYTSSVVFDGSTFTVENRHEPEKIEISGTKTWKGDTAGVRPSSIIVKLYANGEFVREQTVHPDANGNWNYSFKGLDKYADGSEIVYTVEEDPSSAPDYESEVTGYDIANSYTPYGKLRVSKRVEGATSVCEDTVFTFEFQFTRDAGEKDENGNAILEPVFDEFGYKVYNTANDTPVMDGAGNQVGGTVTTNGRLQLRDGQYAIVDGIPKDVHYEVSEQRVPGFATAGTNTSGTIKSNTEQEASFINTYAAETTVSLAARKTLYGGELSPYEFHFELVEVIDGEEVTVAQASNAAADQEGTTEDGSPWESGLVTFGAIRYTQDDAGKTFHYAMREVGSGRKGYTYSQVCYLVDVAIADNGDGTLEATITYFDEQGGVISDPTALEQGAVFENSYEAKGEFTPQVSKRLVGGELAAEQFEFKLYEVNAASDPTTLKELSTAKNAADGTVSFPKITYDQNDIGKKFIYAVSEVIPQTETDYVYDTHYALFSVTVKDNGDGTLTPETKYANVSVDCWSCGGDHKLDDGTECPLCNSRGMVSSGEGNYTFENSYKPGNLDIVKNVSNSTAGDEDQYFTFRVELSNEEGVPIGVDASDVTIEQQGQSSDQSEAQTESAASSASGNAPAANAGDAAAAPASEEETSGQKQVYGPEVRSDQAANSEERASDVEVATASAEAASTEARATETGEVHEVTTDAGTYTWSLADGVLTIGGIVTAPDDSAYFPWYEKRSEITKVIFEEGSSGSGSLDWMFYECSKLESVEFNGFDTTYVTNMSYMFYRCEALTSLDVSGWNTSSVTNMSHMFYECEALTSLDVSGWDTSSVTNMSHVFYRCRRLTSLDVSNWETGLVTNMSALFSGCSLLTSLDVSGWDASSVTDMSDMFHSCYSLTSLDVSEWKTGKVTNMSGIFANCNFKSLEVSGWNTESLTDASSMFVGCQNLENLDLSTWDISKVKSLDYMFYGDQELTFLDVSGWETKGITSMSNLFDGCSSLVSLDVSGWDTSSVTDMYRMFYDCEALTSLDVSGWDTARVEDMGGMFQGCSSLTSLDVSEWNTGNVTKMSFMFSGSGLDSLDCLADLDMSKVTNMESMFESCSNLVEVEVPAWTVGDGIKINYMFSGCENLLTLDMSEFKPSVWQARGLVEGCGKLEELDVSGLDLTENENCSDMFDGCNSLRKVVLGAGFRFRESYASWTSSELPEPSVGSGKWVRVDADGEPIAGSALTSEALAEAYPNDPAVPGTYVWDTFLRVTYDVNGGSGSISPQTINILDGLTLPDTSGIWKTGSVFSSWNTTADGSGDRYFDGQEITADQLAAYGDAIGIEAAGITLYAQWGTSGITDPTFGSFEIKMKAGYVAHVEGIPAGTSYKVYEETPSGWVLVESSGTTGVIVSNETMTAEFTNEKSSDDTTAQIVASKMLDRTWADASDGFSFELYETTDGKRELIDNASVSDGGVVAFKQMRYTAEGTYTYEIVEKNGGEGHITYDSTSEMVTVTVESVEADPDKGIEAGLKATVTYDDADDDPGMARFVNKTEPGSLSITKKVRAASGDLSEVASGQTFTMQVMVSGKLYSGSYTVGDETRETDDGTITLAGGQTATISGLVPGAPYQVTEISVPAGWKQLSSENESGTIGVGTTVLVTFTNEYSAAGDARLMAYKELEGAVLDDGQFEFVLLDADGEVIDHARNTVVDMNETIPDPEDSQQDVPNPGYGKAQVLFDYLEYDAPGTYTYTIREIVPEDAVNEDGVSYKDATPEQKNEGGFAYQGVTYDTCDIVATVTVTDDGDGTLSTSVSYQRSDGAEEKGNVFVNKTEKTQLKVTKRVANEELSEAASNDLTFGFTISLKDASGESLGEEVAGTVYDAATEAPVEPTATITVSDGGSFSLEAGQYVLFEDVPYGTVYEVTETERPGWSQVAEETTGTSGMTSDELASAVFVNAYSASGEVKLEAAKTIDGKLPEDGQFTFLLYDVTNLGEGAGHDPAQPLQSVRNGADGMVRFEPIDYTAADDGKTFTYEIRELQGAAENVSYDETVVTAKVSVRDNGDGTMKATVTYLVDGQKISEDWYTFQNWLKVTLASTGGPGVWAAGAGTVIVVLGCLAYLHRRRERDLTGAKHARQ